ncbi:MAG: homoserine O-succinyltransferase MetA [Anaerolineae bacterium]
MPIVQHSDLPSFDKLRAEGEEVLPLNRALSQDIRELHIGLLNMMPDAALEVTERQFMRLLGSSNQIVQLFVHPFTVPGLTRSVETQAYIDRYYKSFDELCKSGLDAIIITGANVANPHLHEEPFWETLTRVMAWAQDNVTSVLCSCLSTHALMKFYYHIDRQPLPEKKWGIYSHRITAPWHPLLRNINTRFDVPHSRHNAITREHFEQAGLPILIESDEGGVHMAVSPDHLRIVYFQGHPEYDINSLLKEYKREVLRYLNDERDEPPFPKYYFNEKAMTIASKYLGTALHAKANGAPIPVFPEDEILPHIDNTWGDTGKAIFNNWLGLVYKYTGLDRKQPFCEGINPDNPLGLLG